MQLVCNASPLIFLAKIDLIDVLPQLSENLTIPVGVYQEIKGQNDAAGEWVEKHKNKYVIEINTIPKVIESWDLGKGETEVIAHAYSKNGLLKQVKRILHLLLAMLSHNLKLWKR